MHISSPFLTAFVVTLIGIIWIAWGKTSKARDNEEFSISGRTASSWKVSGVISGTLVGGASTIGTAQLAFLYGLSAWWFTLGAGLACLVLGLCLARPLHNSGAVTIPQFIASYYGEKAQIAASLYSALGMFIQIVAQLLACGAVLAVLFHLPLWVSALISALLVVLITLGGGMKSAGTTGIVKMALIYVTMIVAGWMSYTRAGGLSGLRDSFPVFPWFSLFGYGTREGLSDLMSMLVGIVSTQIYLQAIFSAGSAASARRGALLSAAIIPPIGILGVSVGLYMRQQNPGLQSALAMPTFIMTNFPDVLAGVAFATLLIAAIGSASGLALGVATTLKVDVLWRIHDRKETLLFSRVLTACVVASAFVLLLCNLGSAIMEWSFLAIGLRGATLCFPLLFAVFGWAARLQHAGRLAIMIAPLCVIGAGFLQVKLLPPLYCGLVVSFLILASGNIVRLYRKR